MADQTPVPLMKFPSNSKADENIIITKMTTDLLTMKFCTYQDSYAVLVRAKFHCDQTDIRGNIPVKEHILIEFEIW